MSKNPEVIHRNTVIAAELDLITAEAVYKMAKIDLTIARMEETYFHSGVLDAARLTKLIKDKNNLTKVINKTQICKDLIK